MRTLDLNDPIGFSEITYSDEADNIFAISNSVIFGLKGNNIITSSYGGGIMTIIDNKNSSND
jgi:hypothetical protein